MPTECSAKPMGFARVDGRTVVADFEGGAITSNAGGLLLGATDRATGLVERFAACFTDGRSAERVVHEVATLVGRGCSASRSATRTWSTTTGFVTIGVVLGRLEARHGRCAALAGKSTLNRLERGAAEADRYRRIAHDGPAIEALFVDLFLDAHAQAPKEIVLDLDATDDPLHGHQEGRFFHGYYIPEDEAREALLQLDPLWDELFPAEQARIVQLLVDRVDVGTAGVRVHLRTNGLAGLVGEVGGTGTRVAA